MKIVKKPWGEERWFTDNKMYMGKVLIIYAHQRGSFHYHRLKHETMYVFEGDLLLISDLHDDPITLPPGSCLVIPPKTQHSLGAGYQRVVLFEASTSHPEDSVRVHDFYGRECNARRLNTKLSGGDYCVGI